MPNHIKNRITINGTPEQVDGVVERFGTYHEARLDRACDNGVICENAAGEFGWLDEATGVFKLRDYSYPKATFKERHGLPEGFKQRISPAFLQFPDFEKVIPPPENMLRGNLNREAMIAAAEKGIPNWYDWQAANWGTKWNAYSCRRESWCQFTFETAWAGVPGIVQRISKDFPSIEFGYAYSDEDIGYNCATGTLRGGEFISITEPEGGSVAAYELAFLLRPEYREYYDLVDGKYVNNEG